MIVAGTRPECLKLVSTITALRGLLGDDVLLVNSGQHQAMVERSFAQFGIRCDRSLGSHACGSLSRAISSLRSSLRAVVQAAAPQLIVAQGDTSTAYATALAARDCGTTLAHIEAGLRTAHPFRPFPEECFRRRIARSAGLHFAPTPLAVKNLIGEGVNPGSIHLVGNTIIDLLREQYGWPLFDISTLIPKTSEFAVLTLHRRENYGRLLDHVCRGIIDLLDRCPDLGIVCPLHPNALAAARIHRHLTGHPRVVLLEPLDYRPFIALLARSRLIITDSGGIQEEAPYLGTPVLVVRENTERPEGIALGVSTLVNTETHSIAAESVRLLSLPRPTPLAFDGFAAYGDGHSGIRITSTVLDYLRAQVSLPTPDRADGLLPAAALP
ncbi:MAG: UDP-N-acetylglucosamine 2-epimerase (non-hydrolyzing) [Xanthomonadales bacterium]|nr:UDP-N-acetylglucosamine 2-epimerase (non-hydrolyzing) [Xanthomonadales bacterium]